MQYTPALACYSQTFWLWKCRMHALAVRRIWYSTNASSNINYVLFLWLMWSVVYMK